MTHANSKLSALILARSLWIILGSVCTLGAAAQEPVVKVLYPPPDGVLPVAGFLQTYLAVETSLDCLCRYAASDVAFEAMTPFTNSNGGKYHTHHLLPEIGKQYKYYIRCQSANNNVSAPAVASFSMADSPNGVPANLLAVATSPNRVLLSWTVPDSKTTAIKIYRDGSLIGQTPAGFRNFVDTGLQPETTHRYALSAVIGHEGPKSPEAVAITPPENVDHTAYPPAMLESFEEGLRMLNPGSSEPNQHLWQHVCGDNSHRACSQGNLSITTEDSHDGGSSLKYEMTDVVMGKATQASSAYLRFRSMTDVDNARHNAREYITSGKWKLDTYNRLRFWIKLPPAFAKEFKAGTGQGDMQFGTYIRASHGKLSGAGAEESGLGGGHFYHTFNIPYTGVWHQVIIDMHPTHGRGGQGGIEWGNSSYPTGEKGFNYFDALTVFYVDAGAYHALAEYPADFYFDDFEFYKDTNPENVDQIFSLNGVYVPADHRIYVGWGHPKDDGKTKYEVRYAFEDIYSLPNKFDSAMRAPRGTVSPPGSAYNIMEYSTTGINVEGHDVVYVAIKPVNSTLFRQIVLPVHARTVEPRAGEAPHN